MTTLTKVSSRLPGLAGQHRQIFLLFFILFFGDQLMVVMVALALRPSHFLKDFKSL